MIDYPRRPPTGRAARRIALGTLAMALVTATPTASQWVQANEQFYFPADHNWVFRQNFVGADRLFNAFDYGHAILYETLLTQPDAPASRLEEDEFDFLTQELLRRPPRVPLEEGAVEIAYARLVPEAKLMFEWAHVLHRQLYDILADERLSRPEQDAAIAEVLAYYRSRPDIAFSAIPKSMELMDGQPYSLAFREAYPKFNGLIWAYHWLQVGLYEPLVVNEGVAGRTAGVTATVGRFWQMLESAPETTPYLMPMTAGIAPAFAARYPEAAIIFDNLHMMHDVISDILASPVVPRAGKRAAILEAAEIFRDDTSHVISRDEWAMMTGMMGLNNMGGPAIGFTDALPEPTVPRGMSMSGMDHSAMTAQPTSPGVPDAAPVPVDHAAMGHGIPPSSNDPAATMDEQSVDLRALLDALIADDGVAARIADDVELAEMMMSAFEPSALTAPPAAGGAPAPLEQPRIDLLLRLLADPVVEARIHASPQLHQLWSGPAVQAELVRVRAER